MNTRTRPRHSCENSIDILPGGPQLATAPLTFAVIPPPVFNAQENIAQSCKILYGVNHDVCETVKMKNITVSVDEETYWLSRLKAAESGTSVSALVRSYLVDLVHGRTPDTRFDCLHKLQDETLEAIRARGGGLRSADNLPRGALHESDALR